ncbi:MAG: site-2 protease family protein [Phycisphaerae bacterium]|nr:site-2 protease family protein [Phycisphaerae bacterium]MCZ2399029.1 site-2 protease family protein [Phycisphaerae bacterium]
MRWSYRIARVAGIDIYVHVTFALLIFVLAIYHYQAGGWLALFEGIGFVLALFGCVVLHELGHALAARGFGVATRDITLLPIGGLARLERMPARPLQELWVAVAGPLVNVVIAAALLIGLLLTVQLSPLEDVASTGGRFVERLMYVNVFLVVFNMLPAFPMDGGRVLRALLATRLDHARATQIAASIGQAMAVVFGLLGLFGNPILLLIALFVWIGAAQESSAAQAHAALGGASVRSAMLSEFRVLRPGQTLRDAVHLILSGSQQDFPVVDEGVVAGILTRRDLLVELARRESATPVELVMRRDFISLSPGDRLEQAAMRLQESDCQTAPVVEGDQLVGLLTLENIGEFLMIRAALAAGRKPPARARAIGAPEAARP